MVLRSRQKLWQKIVFSWVTVLVLFVVAIMLSRSVLSMYKKNSKAMVRAQDTVAELIKIEDRERVLKKSLERVKTTQGIEEELRRKFDVSRDDEHLLVIVDKEVEPKKVEVQESWISNLWHKLTE